MLRSLLSSILNINLDHDGSWLQATLPVRAGGLGVRRAVQLAPSAFLSSAAGCSSLIREILPPCVHACVDPHIDLALTAWKQSHSESPPSLPESSHRRFWGAPLIAATITSLLDGASQQATARLLAAATPLSGAWLNALPISSVGLKVDGDVVRMRPVYILVLQSAILTSAAVVVLMWTHLALMASVVITAVVITADMLLSMT